MAPRTRSAPKGSGRPATDLPALVERAYMDRDLSQEAAARASRISVSAFRKILAGTTKPQERTIRRIGNGLKTPVNPLLIAAGFSPVPGGDEVADVDDSDEMDDRMSRVEQAVRNLDERQDRTDHKLDQMQSKMEDEFADVKRLITELVPARSATGGTPQSAAASRRSVPGDVPPERPGPQSRARSERDAR